MFAQGLPFPLGQRHRSERDDLLFLVAWCSSALDRSSRSTYHTIRQTGDLRTAGESEERITAVASWRDAPYFTEAERVALELVEAVLIPNPFGERVPDDLFTRASAHYDEKAL